MNATPKIKADDELGLLRARYQATREISKALIKPLSAEDACVQSMPDCSPAKWHLAHTTWFFETFLLEQLESYQCFHDQFRVLFNSYYNAVGEQYPRPARGLLTRPSLADVLAYRDYVDEQMQSLFDAGADIEQQRVIEVGIQHEQQHQELLLMDIKHLLSLNPLRPTYRERNKPSAEPAKQFHWTDHPGGLVNIGASGEGFCFDNETPRHQHFTAAYKLGSRLVTNGEYLEFINDDAYSNPALWLSDGWACVQEHKWRAPLYWRKEQQGPKSENNWFEFTLHGEHELDLDAPVVHLSFYEADAFARWAGARLPTEMEWENAVNQSAMKSAAVNESLVSRLLHPSARVNDGSPRPDQLSSSPATLEQVFTDVWQWTGSAYLPYPGYVTPPGAIGEYNGKFMSNQMVLKGACCVTPESHSRASYRNFFYPHCRWQFAGLRLAR